MGKLMEDGGERMEKKLTVDGGRLMGKLMEDGGERMEKKLTVDRGQLRRKMRMFQGKVYIIT